MAARMRTIQEAMVYLKANDPDTAVTAYALRRMVLTEEIPSIKVGCKYLLNLDRLEEYLSNAADTRKAQAEEGRRGFIRPLPERMR